MIPHDNQHPSQSQSQSHEVKRAERRQGPSTFTLTVAGVISIISIAGTGVGVYATVQSDIASLKRGEIYQERTNERLSEEIKSSRAEQRETMREFNTKLDVILEKIEWHRRR